MPFDLNEQVARVELLLDLLANGRLQPEQAAQVTSAGLPRLIVLLLRAAGVASAERICPFLKMVLEVTVQLLRDTDTWEIVESATRVLTDTVNHTFYTRSVGRSRSPSCDIDCSQSDASYSDGSQEEGAAAAVAGEGAAAAAEEESILTSGPASDDCSPYYAANVEYFNTIGGFSAILSRIGREPRLSLTAVRVMLRPFVKVKHLLRRAALLSFGRLIYETVLAHIDALTDEQIKQEERRTM